MGRVYTFSTGLRAVTAAVDLLEITAAATKALRILRVTVSQSSDYGDSNAEGLQVQLARAATTGSTGTPTTVTGRPHSPGDAAFAGSAKFGNDVDAGTQTPIVDEAWNAQAGFQWAPANDQYIEVAPSGIFVVHLSKIPADSLDILTTVTVEEIG